MCDPCERGAADVLQRPRLPLRVARLGRRLPCPPGVIQGLLTGQLGHDGALRQARERVLLRQDWRGVAREEFDFMLNAHLCYHDEARPKESLGGVSPLQCGRGLDLAA